MHLYVRKSYSRKSKKVSIETNFLLVKTTRSGKIFIIEIVSFLIETTCSQKTSIKEIFAKRKFFVNVFVILTIIITKIASKIFVTYSRII